MTGLELLAPARNAAIGIAAIDCGADAVYIAGPAFGARKDAGNRVEDLIPLIDHAHKFGAKVFVTFNIAVEDSELETMHDLMLDCQEKGADAFIIRDERICGWKDITVPLHASTQCAIRSIDRARHFAGLGCKRIVLERELPLTEIKKISADCGTEVECFVHGALCVCYSGQCRLSEHIDGRSADRGECIQACRSLYDLVDEKGNVLVHNKALLSLKDLKLIDRLAELAEAGVMSFKIEGRLKNVSYVKNVVRAYSLALDRLVEACPDKYKRASFGHSRYSFTPDLDKTFNRGYTELFLDGRRGKWASMDAPKSMGEQIGTVASVKQTPSGAMEISLVPAGKKVDLHNGDGFAFISKNAIEGFRGDVCEGRRILCKRISGIHKGTVLYRNISTSFEKELEKEGTRELNVAIRVKISGNFKLDIWAECEDGSKAFSPFNADVDAAENRDRAEALLRDGLGKRVEHYSCRLTSLESEGKLPLLSASTINAIRRAVVSDLRFEYDELPASPADSRSEASHTETPLPARPDNIAGEPLMRSKYCIRYELNLCPVHQGAKHSGALFLLNNGRRFALEFDCSNCEMLVKKA